MPELSLTPNDVLNIEREYCRRSLAGFAKRAWHILEPSTELKWGWALDCVCAHLEAVTRGEITRLLLNVPPGSMKSLLTGVIWPAWEWGPQGKAHLRYLGTAHMATLAIRDATKCRRLIQSEWYRTRWPVQLTTDQNAKTKFENSATGFREAMAFTSMTGSRGDRIILDDPISAFGANSEAERRESEITFTETLPTRINNDASAIVVIMQRLHEQDVSGLILSRKMGYTHVCLPMRFEKEQACKTLWYRDPRAQEGELLFPERFSEEAVTKLETDMGSYASAGQLQQRPVPRGGGMFKRDWFEVVTAVPAGCRWVRGWDLAATQNKDAAATAGVLIGKSLDGRFYIADVQRIQGTAMEVERLLRNTAARDKQQYGQVTGSIPQDPGQAGKAQAQHLIKMLAGHNYRASPESGDKVSRADGLSAQAEAGNVCILKGDWNAVFLDEISNFPNGKFKDQVDAATRGFHALTTARDAPKVSSLRF